MSTSTRSKKNTRRSAEARAELAANLHAQLTEAVEALTASDSWSAYLDHLASFHSYSLRNVMLILSQKPNATQVAGFRQWQERGRQVRKGEKAIRIFGYSTKKITTEDPSTGEETEQKVSRFPILSVFDINQTDPIEGHPANDPTIAPQLLTGEDSTGIADALTNYLTGQGWTIETEQITSGANGYTTTDGSHRIALGDHLEPAARVKTLIHEAAHALMHASPEARADAAAHRGTREMEAESVAYVLAGMWGLDTSAYSVAYVAGWSTQTADEIRDTAERVQATVRTLAAAIEDHNQPEE